MQMCVGVCRCMFEAGDSEFMQENNDACRDAISKELGVDNWEKVNFSQNPELSAKFDDLAKRCQQGVHNTPDHQASNDKTDGLTISEEM